MAYDPAKHGPERVVGPGFFAKVYAVVRTVPAGRVTTYGDVAAALGLRSVARKVGHALAALPDEPSPHESSPHESGPDRPAPTPWFRVVNARGCLSRPLSTPAGREQAELLRAENVEVHADGRITDFAGLRFVPDREETEEGS